MKPVHVLLIFLALAMVFVLGGSFYTVSMTETAILTQFGRPVGAPISEPGLHFKTPFVQEVHRLEKRVLEWDGPTTEMPTKDKTYIQVDAFGRWQIADAAKYFVTLRDERSAQSRLEDIIGSEIRAAVASHDLIELVRSDIKRVLPQELKERADAQQGLAEARRGRRALEQDILNASVPKLQSLGIDLLDVRIKRVNYNASVLQTIYERMKSERLQIAQRFRSEGQGEAARIDGKRERDLRRIESVAYKQVQQTRGEADAEATRIYAEAYNQTPQAAAFYAFTKTMETWQTVLSGSSLVLSTDSDLFRMFKQAAAAK